MNPRDLPLDAVLHGPPIPPRMAARMLAAAQIKGCFKSEGLHPYADAAGQPLYWRLRVRLENGEKWIRPMSVQGMVYALTEPDFGGKPKPLYRLHELAAAGPATPIWWVEGEQKADKLAALGFVATTAGGANDDEARDFEPLRGRRVVIWPDNDAPGQAHALRVAEKVRAFGGTVERIDVAVLGLPESGDAVDYLREHPGAEAGDLLILARLPMDHPKATAAVEVELIRGDQVTIEPVRWTWTGWLARGKLHILAGAPGTGKTTIALAFAATITSGGRWPDGSTAEVGDVMMWTGEDDPADTLAPRLKAMGADLGRVHFVGTVRDQEGIRAFDPALDIDLLRNRVAASNIRPKLLIVDPVVNAVGGDSHKNTEVRRALAPLCDLARSLDCIALGISHFSKGSSGKDPVERVTGSLAFGALARVVLAAAKRPEDQGGGRFLARAKSNIGLDGGGFAYSLEVTRLTDQPEVEASRLLWGEGLEGTARELLAEADADSETGSDTSDAAEWLRDLLASGPIDSNEVKRAGEANGISWATLRRAKKRIGAESEKDGMAGGWSWFLPKMLKDAKDAQQKKVSTFGKGEHLRAQERGEHDDPGNSAEVF